MVPMAGVVCRIATEQLVRGLTCENHEPPSIHALGTLTYLPLSPVVVTGALPVF